MESAARCCIITGTSQGVGKALANLCLQNGDIVIGISRAQALNHPHYHHLSIDLAERDYIEDQAWDRVLHPMVLATGSKKWLLINNAGVVGPIGHVGTLDAQAILKSQMINAVAPFILTNALIGFAKSERAHLTVLNTGTGASRKPFEGWSTYCSTKAATAMLDRVIALECQSEESVIKLVEFELGAVDTQMQKEIRESESEKFPQVQMFKDWKDQGRLISPETAAQLIFERCRD
ncbi:MAG: SDR family NAD(P)-dependent oxidoreductase [Proteobacteria bacterium]|nr:MAG: SDR family NAD(P)-dependent oxidoreductase [Pseudomonadota bacterium]